MRPWERAVIAVTLVLLATACGASDGGDSSDQATVHVGDKAPNFTLPSATGERVSLSQYRGKKPVLLYFSMGPG
jgi:cytochrome oxidase Cu insertion factor (SCO1/SenC/PrrC family)